MQSNLMTQANEESTDRAGGAGTSKERRNAVMNVFGKLTKAAGVAVTGLALITSVGLMAGQAYAESKGEDISEEMEFSMAEDCEIDGGKSEVARVTTGGSLVTTCTYPDESKWGCTESGYCEFKEGKWSEGEDVDVFQMVNDPDFLNIAPLGQVLALPDSGNSYEPKSIPELIQECLFQMGEPILVIEMGGGVYVVCEVEDGDGGYGWACGDLRGDGGYDCRLWDGDGVPFSHDVTSGFSISDSGVTKAGAMQTGFSKGAIIENTEVIAKATDACETDADEPQGPGGSVVDPGGQTSAPGPGGSVADPSDPPADPEKKLPFTSGFNIDGSQTLAPVDETEPCDEPDEGDVEPTPEPADEEPVDEPEVEQPVDETPEQPAAEEPVPETPVTEQPVNDEPKDEVTNELSTNGAAAENALSTNGAADDEQADDASAESEDESVETLIGEKDGKGGIGLMGVLLGAGLAMPVALGAVFMRRRNG